MQYIGGTFQLGDETSDENRADFAAAIANQYVENFILIAIRQTEKIGIEDQDTLQRCNSISPDALQAVFNEPLLYAEL